MKDQRFLDEDWDHAIILDSARFDVFNDIYQDYFSGEIEKRKSPASATPEWADKVLRGRQNINWFSANPFINGKGMPLKDTGMVEYETVPSRHIAHVVDLWEEAWDKELGSVEPEKVNKEFMKRKDKLSDRRNVIHYMQPHAPFLGKGSGRINKQIKESFSNISDESGLRGKAMDKISDPISRIENTEIVMKLGLLSSLNYSSLIEVLRNDTRQTFMEYHEDNMRKVMEHAAELAEELEGKVIITSDHGEAFGEKGVWEHHAETHIPCLVEVPWLEVEKVK